MMRTGFKLNDAFKTFTLDQDKIFAPEETVRRFRERLGKIDLDILEETVRIDNGRLGIPVFFSRCGQDARRIIGTKKQMGKGATPQQAEASAVMELAERFSFFSYVRNPANFFTDTAANLGSRALSFASIARSVHDETEDTGVTRSIFEHLPLRWANAYSLTRQRQVAVPFDWFFMINQFNGPSAGNCPEEALCQGICEIVERHVSAIVSRQRLKVPAIRADSASDPMVREMIAKYRRAGVKIYLSDFSLDTGVPTVGILAYDPSTFPHLSEIVWTAGTTPNPEKALSRALTETAQLAGDFNTGANFVASGLPKFSRLEEGAFIMHPGRETDIASLPDQSNDNIRIEVENLVGTLARRDMEVIVIDTRHHGLDIPAFYTIVPGAHFRERAEAAGTGMFTAKLIAEQFPAPEALRRLEEMEGALPGKYYLSFFSASCQLQLGNTEEALAGFRRARELDPHPQDLASIYAYTAICLKDLGQYREALDVLRQGEAVDSERTDIYNLMGFCHFMLKEHEQAIASFSRVLALDPSSAIDYANIASNYRDMGERQKAVEFYELALSMDPTIDFARENLSKLK